MTEEKQKKLSSEDEAKIKDKILKILCTENKSKLIDDLQKELGVSRLVLITLIEDERNYLIYTRKKGEIIDAEYTPAQVTVTREGEYLFHHGKGFVGIYNNERTERRRGTWKQIFNGIYAFMLIVFTALAAWGSINTKLYDKKEYRLETKNDSLQSQVDQLHELLNAIPDTILYKYLPSN